MAKFEDVVKNNNIPHRKVTTPEEVENALVSLAPNEPDVLIINAGDGTVDNVVGMIRNKKDTTQSFSDHSCGK